MFNRGIAVCSLTLCFGLSATAAVINGGFEEPVLTGTFLIVNPGSPALTGWKINDQGVLVLTNDYSEGLLQFDSQSGNQHLDLTGAGNTGLRSIEQDVATDPGVGYLLTFWVGNQDDTFQGYGLASSLNLVVNGTFVNSYTNADTTPGNVNWKQFQYGFVANSALTNLRFENATPLADSMLGLDDVSLERESNVPEPGSMALLGIGLLGFVALRRR